MGSLHLILRNICRTKIINRPVLSVLRVPDDFQQHFHKSVAGHTCKSNGELRASTFKTSRHFSSTPKIVKNKNLDEIESDDPRHIGEGTWKEVYSGILTTQFKLLKTFSIGSSIVGLSLQPILYEKVANANVAVFLTLGTVVGFFTFVTPVLIHWISKKYVTKLEYDPKRDVYSATTLSFFLKEKKLQFKVEDVKLPKVPGMFTTFLVKNKPLFVDPGTFEDIDHYSRLMGYDKPIDFSLDRDKDER